MTLTDRVISVVIVLVLAALPVSGTVCAMECGVDAMRTGSAAACPEHAAIAMSPHVQAASGHDCDQHEAHLVASATFERVNPSAMLLLPVAVAQLPLVLASVILDSPLDRQFARSSSPPLLALRI